MALHLLNVKCFANDSSAYRYYCNKADIHPPQYVFLYFQDSFFKMVFSTDWQRTKTGCCFILSLTQPMLVFHLSFSQQPYFFVSIVTGGSVEGFKPNLAAACTTCDSRLLYISILLRLLYSYSLSLTSLVVLLMSRSIVSAQWPFAIYIIASRERKRKKGRCFKIQL